MEYAIKKIPTFNVVGVELTVTNPEQAYFQIGEFWETFRTQKIKETIPNKMSPYDTIAVYTNYNRSSNGYSLILGARTIHTVNIPDTMVGITIPEQTYAVIRVESVIPQHIQETWKKVWDMPINRRFTYDFEVYKDEELDTAHIEFYISIASDMTHAP